MTLKQALVYLAAFVLIGWEMIFPQGLWEFFWKMLEAIAGVSN